ncbi:MAG: hypothetical protein NVS1B16_05940 [Pseudarthrobacter sp.]
MHTTATTTATASLPRKGSGLTIIDPRTGEYLWSVPEAGPGAVEDAVGMARSAASGWAAVAPAERGAALRSAARALDAAAEDLAALNSSETGRPYNEALAGIAAGVSTLEQYAELGPLHRGHSLLGSRAASDYTVAEPRGVAVLLTPWNDPVAVACGLIGAALVTGNTVLHKPRRWGKCWQRRFRPGSGSRCPAGPGWAPCSRGPPSTSLPTWDPAPPAVGSPAPELKPEPA